MNQQQQLLLHISNERTQNILIWLRNKDFSSPFVTIGACLDLSVNNNASDTFMLCTLLAKLKYIFATQMLSIGTAYTSSRLLTIT